MCGTEGVALAGGDARTCAGEKGRRAACLLERCRSPQDGSTPLHWAVHAGHAVVVEQLLTAGVFVEVRDKVRGMGVAGREGQNAAF